MNKPYGFILHAYTQAEKSAEFAELFGAFVAPSRAEDGCIEYHMLRDRQNPKLFIFYEIWQSEAHLKTHSALPHMQDFHKNRMDYLTQDFEIRPIKMLSPSSAQR